MTDDRSRGVYLDGKHLVFVFMACAVVAVVVFLCGVLVGRGVPLGRTAADGAMLTPTQVVSDGGTDSVGGDSPPAGPGEQAGTALSYSGRLGKTPPAEHLQVQAESGPPQPPAESVPPEVGEALGAEADSSGGSHFVQLEATTKRAEAVAAVRYLKTKGFDAFMIEPGPGDKPATFRVRVGAFTTRKEAEALAQRITRETRYKRFWLTR